MKNRPQPVNRIAPLNLLLFCVALFAAFGFLPRINGNQHLLWSFLGTAAVLFLGWLTLRISAQRSGRVLSWEFVPIKSHWVQLIMHSCIYTYWGMYWPEVYRHIPLILGQVVFLYALDMIVCWSRRDKWLLGFGPIPIIFSTNLFLWFRDDWFWLQFLLIATGVLFKEFVRWERDGRKTHIFNPSAIALFIFSVALLASNTTGITWGPEIAKSLHLPPYIYPEIFVIGLVVQGLFSVTLMTLSAAAMLYALNLAYTRTTGVYHFVDSNIPVSVFIGLHLLVTDPATSPKRMTGKIIFGGLYGAAVFGLYALLGAFLAPQYYDKLLCVPFLNLSVRALDRFSVWFAARFHPLNLNARWGPRTLNFAHMGIWATLFGIMFATGFVGHSHPGASLAFWDQACKEGRYNSCKTWAHALVTTCRNNIASSCLAYGKVISEGRILPADKLQAGETFGRACDLGLRGGCVELATFSRNGGSKIFDEACAAGNTLACYVDGELYFEARGVPPDFKRGAELFRKTCEQGFPEACARLGQSYLLGRGTTKDLTKASENFEKACAGGDAQGCYGSAFLYLRGNGVAKDETVAEARMENACRLGMLPACTLLTTPLVAKAKADAPVVLPGLQP
jgi:hypothetical protein